MGKAIVVGGTIMTPPVGVTSLSELAVGSIVKLNESGSPVEFYIAKHDYESELNGIGRTLLVRKDCYDMRAWHSSNYNEYSTSDIDKWLNSTYKGLLDTDIQSAISITNFRYLPSGKNSAGATTLSRAIFLLSSRELGHNLATDGSVLLDIADTLKIAYTNDAAANQWTRTPVVAKTSNVYIVGYKGTHGAASDCTLSQGSRPCLTLPTTALVAADGTIKI